MIKLQLEHTGKREKILKAYNIQLTRKKSNYSNIIQNTKRNVDKLKKEILQYYDRNGYLSWSEKKKKYVLLGTNSPQRWLCECPSCKMGKLIIVYSRATKKRFIGCSNYYNGCNTSAPLIQRGTLMCTKQVCTECSWPIILHRYSRKQKWNRQCTNMDCKTRQAKKQNQQKVTIKKRQ